MVPAVSWPKMRGGGTVPCWIFLMSVGQTPQTATLTSSSFGADARDGDGFEAQVVDAAINDGAHGFGDVEHGGYLATDETQMKHGFFAAKMTSGITQIRRRDAKFICVNLCNLRQKSVNHGSGSQENSTGWPRQTNLIERA